MTITGSIAVEGVANVYDGVHADVTLVGTSSGSVSILTSSLPDVAGAAVTPVIPLGGGVYRCRVHAPGLWYFWASDATGVTAEPCALWVGQSDDIDLNDCAIKLRDILTEHKEGLEAGLRQVYFPDTTLKHIEYGNASTIFSFPAVLVTKPRETVEWVAFPLMRKHRYQFEIFTFVVHQERMSGIKPGGTLAGRCMEVLNKPEYDVITLASGLSLAFCLASTGDVEDVQIEDNVFCSTGSIVWSGEALK